MRWQVAARVAMAVVLLAVIAAGTGAARPTRVRDTGPLAQVAVDLVAAGMVLLLVFGFAAVVMVVLASRGTERKPGNSNARIVKLVIVLLLVAAALTRGAFLLRREGDDKLRRQLLRPIPEQEDERKEPLPHDERSPQWLVVFGLSGAVLAAGAALLVWNNRRPDLLLDHSDDDLLPRVATTSLAALDDVTDPRLAVIAAYHAMETLLAAHDLPRRPSQTPFEYVERVLVDLGAAVASSRALAGLFAVARYSSSEVSVLDRAEARAALVAIGAGVGVDIEAPA